MQTIGFIKTYVMESGPEVSYTLLLDQMVKKDVSPILIELDLKNGRLNAVDYGKKRRFASYPLRPRWGGGYTRQLAARIALILKARNVTAVDLLYNKKSTLLYHHLIDRCGGMPFFLRFYHSVLTEPYRTLQTLNTEGEKALFRKLVARVDRCTAISGYIKNNVERVCGPSIGEKVVVIPDGVPLPGPAGGRRTAAGGRDPYIVFAGRIESFKGIDLLLFAFHDFAGKYPSVGLRVIGEGRLKKQLQRLADALALRDKVTFAGWQDYRTVQRYIRDSAFLVLPSRVEPFGRPLIEAMAWGKAVVAANVGGMPEIIRHGKNGLLADPEPAALCRAMCRLYGDGRLMRRIGDRNRKEARYYDIRRIADLHISLYEKEMLDHRLGSGASAG